jgi:alkanesulfonate monooxygenase SsuD/methylene tetrahydromethanopterin reductase-like flavin-dependent oxidoreductase (luciferase family)
MLFVIVLASFGVYLPQTNVSFNTVKKVIVECERLGYDSAWLFDHLMGFASPNDSVLECWTTLTALAASTSTIRLGTLVLCNNFRHPPVLAKMAATFDTISNGRLDLGIGAGWYRPEYEAYGIPFQEASVRISQLAEGLEIIKRMWTEEKTTFLGQYYDVKNAICIPKPLQKPHPPIWVGVMIGKKRMFDIVAKHGDGWTISSLYLPTPTEYKSQLEILQTYCKTRGRNPEGVKKALGVGCIIAENKAALQKKLEKFKPGKVSIDIYQTVQPRLIGTPDELVERFREYINAGATHFLINFPDVTDDETIRLFSDRVIKAL